MASRVAPCECMTKFRQASLSGFMSRKQRKSEYPVRAHAHCLHAQVNCVLDLMYNMCCQKETVPILGLCASAQVVPIHNTVERQCEQYREELTGCQQSFTRDTSWGWGTLPCSPISCGLLACLRCLSAIACSTSYIAPRHTIPYHSCMHACIHSFIH